MRLLCDWPERDLSVEALLLDGESLYALSERGLERELLCRRERGHWLWQDDSLEGLGHGQSPRLASDGEELVAFLGGRELVRDPGFRLYVLAGQDELYLRRQTPELVAYSAQGLWTAVSGDYEPSSELVVAPLGFHLPEWTKAQGAHRGRESALAR